MFIHTYDKFFLFSHLPITYTSLLRCRRVNDTCEKQLWLCVAARALAMIWRFLRHTTHTYTSCYFYNYFNYINFNQLGNNYAEVKRGEKCFQYLSMLSTYRCKSFCLPALVTGSRVVLLSIFASDGTYRWLDEMHWTAVEINLAHFPLLFKSQYNICYIQYAVGIVQHCMCINFDRAAMYCFYLQHTHTYIPCWSNFLISNKHNDTAMCY